MKILNGSIISASTLMLLAVFTSTCIAEGLITESMRRVTPDLPDGARQMDEAHRNFKGANPNYNDFENYRISPENTEHPRLDRNLYRLNLCYSEPKPTWCK